VNRDGSDGLGCPTRYCNLFPLSGEVMSLRLNLSSMLMDARTAWARLALVSVICKGITFALFTPLLGAFFHLFVALSGREVLTDEDILFFFLEPLGWLALILVGGAGIAVVALELAALMSIVWGGPAGSRNGVQDALRFAAVQAWPVLRLATRMVSQTILTALPFLFAGAALYLLLLTQFDINYYLTNRPPAFWLAASCIGILGLALSAVLLRLFLGWLLALPLVLFENVPAREALRASRERVAGHRWALARCILVWVLAGAALSGLSAGAVSLLGRWLVPSTTGSLSLLAFLVGGLLLLWAATALALAVATTTAWALLLIHVYRALGGQQPTAPEATLNESKMLTETIRLVRRRWLAALVVASLLAMTVGVVALAQLRLPDRAAIVAHRAGARSAPESTLAAVDQAIADRADWVEVDVQETADGQVVAIHDSDLKKVGGVDLKVHASTLAQLQAIDIGSWFDPRFSGERIPTLDQVLARCKGRANVLIELKPRGSGGRLVERVVEIVEARGMATAVRLMSLKSDAVRKARALRPGWPVGQISAVALGDLEREDVGFLAVSTKMCTRHFVRLAHERNRSVYVWTVNDAATMSVMMGRGVDGIITDGPALARSVLAERASMSSVQRLLLNLAAQFGWAKETSDGEF
jgi:glycerophosphoryl diester phosphodiesterase